MATDQEIQRLIEQLQSDEWRVRKAAASALGKTKDPRVIKPLIGLLKRDAHPDVAASTAKALGNIGEPAIKPLVDLFRYTIWHIRHYAAEALGETKNEKAAGPLVDRLVHVGECDGIVINEALEKIGQPAVEPLIKLLGHKSLQDTISAAKALKKIGQPAVEPLIKLLESGPSEIKYNVIEILGNIGDIRAIKPLMVLLRNKDVYFNKVVKSLEMIVEKSEELQITKAFQECLSTEMEEKNRNNILPVFIRIVKKIREKKKPNKGTLSDGKPKPPTGKPRGTFRMRRAHAR